MDSQVVVVTGASAGVGRATARAFAREGARIGLLARGERGLAATAAEVRRLGGTPLPLQVDVADPAAVDDAAGRVEAELGPLDVWVNNAMTAVLAFVDETPAEEFRRVMEVIYLGQVHGTLSALRRMMPRDRGTIVQVGSALAHRSIPLQASYCAAKHAVKGFSEALRVELLHKGSGVRVTVVQLPGLNTPQFGWVRARTRRHPRPVAPVYQPEVAARAILRAASHPERREYLVGASTVGTVWAGRLAGGLVDRYLARTNVAGQQTEEPLDPNRPDYLFDSVDEDRGAHGAFDDEAHEHSPQFWISARRRSLLTGLAIGGGVLGVAGALRRLGSG